MESDSSSVRSPDPMGPFRNSSGVKVRYLEKVAASCCLLLTKTEHTSLNTDSRRPGSSGSPGIAGD